MGCNMGCNMGCFIDCMKCCTAGFGMLVILGATLGISITNIVIGANNLNSNCTGIEQIPAYLITSGVLSLVAVLVKGSDNDEEDGNEEGDEKNEKTQNQKQKQKTNQFYQLIQLASIGVQIWGSVILFNVDRPKCDRVLYDYAFAVNITAYVLLAMLLLIYSCVFSVICCEACANKCCGDEDGEWKYHCTCCGRICCADDATRANLRSEKESAQKQSNTTPSVVIEMPPIKNMETTQPNHVSEC